MQLVTVTCELDLKPTLLQAESIQKYFQPCTHYIVINDKDPDMEMWDKLLSPYYTNHKLVLLKCNWEKYPVSWQPGRIDPYDGWHSQQVIKYELYKTIQDDYLILDAKNFFVKPTTFKLWNNIIGCGQLLDVAKNIKFSKDSVWRKTYEMYSQEYNVNPTHVLQMDTPFVFRKKHLDKIKDYDKFLTNFNNTTIMPSEFMLYTFLAYEDLHNMTSFKAHSTVWPWAKNLRFPENEHVFGYHRRFLEKLPRHDIEKINNFLKQHKFKNFF